MNFPDMSPEVWEDVNQNADIAELVARMIDAAQEYIEEWHDELTALADQANQGKAVETFEELANSVEDVISALNSFRHGIATQQEGIADFMQQSEEAFQQMKDQAEDTK